MATRKRSNSSEARSAAAAARKGRGASRRPGSSSLALRQLALAAEAARAWAWVWDIGTDRLHWMAPPEDLLGPRPAGGSYPDFREMVHGADRARLLAAGRSALAALSAERRSAPYECAFRLVRTDGEVRTCLARGRAEADRSGRPVRVIGVTVDVEPQALDRALRRRAEGRLSAFLDLAADWFLETDASLRVIFVSDSAEGRSPVARADLLGRALWELPAANLTSADRERLRAQLEQREPMLHLVLEFSPGPRWIVLSAKPSFTDGGRFTGYRAVARDLTPEIEARRAAEEAAKRLRLAIDAAGAIEWQAGPAGEVWLDERWAMLLGRGQGETRASVAELSTLLDPQEAPEVRRALIATLKGEAGQYAMEHRVRTASGWKRIYSLGRVLERDPRTGRALRMVGVNLDVTALRAAEERLEDLFRAVDEGIFFYEHEPAVPTALAPREQAERILECARLARANLAYARMYGESDPQALVGRTLEHFGSRETRLAVLQGYVHAGYRIENALWSETIAGEERWFRGSIYGTVKGGELTGAWGLKRDVTEEQRALRLLTLQRDLLQMVARGTAAEAVIDAMLQGAQSLAPEAIPSFVLLDEPGTHIARSLGPALDEAYHCALEGLAIGPKAGSCGTAAWRGERVVVTDIETDPLWEDYRGLALERGLAACWSEPVRDAAGRVLGTFALYARTARAPSGWEIAVVEALAPLAATALERSRAGRLLAASEARFRDFARAAGEWFWEADAEGRYTWYSEEVERVTGFPREWYYGKTRLELAAAAGEDLDSPRWRAHRKTLEERGSWRDFRYARKAPDGVRWISSSGVPVFDEKGEFTGWRGTGRDVTHEVLLAERARRAESRLAEAIEHLEHAVSLTDAADRIVLVNEAHRRLNPGLPDGSLGRTYEEHLRAGIALGHYPEASGREDAWLAERLAARRAADGRPALVRRQGGSARLVTYSRLADGGILTIAMDVSEQERLRVQLEEERVRFEALFRAAPVPSSIVRPEGEILDCNDAYCAFFGLAREALIGRSAVELGLVDAAERAAAFARARAGGRQRGVVLHVRTAAGEARRVLASVERVAWRGEPTDLIQFLDITERERAAEALRESEERFRSLAELLPDAILVHWNETIMYANQATAALVGAPSAEELVGRSIAEVAAPDVIERIRGRLKRLRAVGERLPTDEQRVRRRDGAERPVATDATLIPWRGGLAYLSVLRDITEFVRQREEIRALNATLEQRVAERTAELQEANRRLVELVRELEAFSYSVSHDLKAPLRAVAGFSRMLVEDEGERLSEEGRRKLAVLERSARTMGELVEGLLSLARVNRETLRIAPLDLAAIAREWLEAAPAAARAAVRIGELPSARGDARLARQLLANLLENALKYSAQADPARVELGWDDAARAYFVRDNGIGFDMAHAKKLFRPFERLHAGERYPGTGIGLAIVRRIAERHGGRVWAEAAPGEGATFYFTLGEE
ncbi:MAG: PAS domain S-box protein [Pseudomonadota bacterium]